jgi:mono/diheme cytochrome c family protein
MKNIKTLGKISFSLIIGPSFFLLSLLQSQAISGPQKSDPGKMAAEGRKIYQVNCATCHGPKGSGDGPASTSLNPKPTNFIKGKFKFGNSEAQLLKTISKGISNSAMPPWKGTLTDDQIHQVMFYIKSLKK